MPPAELPGIGSGNTRCIRRETYAPAEPTPDDYPHKMLGIEIEGYFGSQNEYDSYDRWNPAGAKQFNDRRALAQKLTNDSGNADGGSHCWEFRTTPGDIVHAFNQLHQLYPDGTNAGCGMHVHVSFKNNTDITLLTHPDFWAYFETAFTKWGKDRELPANHPFWTRLGGGNHYCKKNDIAAADHERQYKLYNGNSSWDTVKHNVIGGKYMQLNYGAWSTYRQTLECRMLPMFDKQEDAESAIRCLLDTYAGYLNGYKGIDHKVKVPKVPVKGDGESVYKMNADLVAVKSDKVVVVPKYDLTPSMPGTVMVATPTLTRRL